VGEKRGKANRSSRSCVPTSHLALHVNTVLHYMLTSHALPSGWLSSRLTRGPVSHHGGIHGGTLGAYIHQYEDGAPTVFILYHTIMDRFHQYEYSMSTLFILDCTILDPHILE
jgi:hypothetical protein